MNKSDTINALENSKRCHIMQMKKIKALISGKKVSDLTSVYKTGCVFGKWLHDEENNLQILLGDIFYEDLNLQHSLWHEDYRKIYLIFFKDSQSKKVQKVTPMDIDRCKLYYNELEQISKKLIKTLDSSKRRLEALSEDRFKQK